MKMCGKSYWTTCTSNVSFDGIESPIGDCTTYYGVVVDAYVFGVVVDAYVFKSCLTDKQLEEATGEDWHIYREADKLSVTTGFSLEQLVSAFRYMEFLAGLYNVFYRSDRVLEYVIPYSRGNFNKLLDEIYFYFSC